MDPSTYIHENKRAARKQRAARGWADPDAWSFNTYLAGVIAGGCRHLIEINHGHPVRDGVESPEAWETILRTIADGFEEYAREDEMTEAVYSALSLFHKWFPDLWD